MTLRRVAMWKAAYEAKAKAVTENAQRRARGGKS